MNNNRAHWHWKAVASQKKFKKTYENFPTIGENRFIKKITFIPCDF